MSENLDEPEQDYMASITPTFSGVTRNMRTMLARATMVMPLVAKLNRLAAAAGLMEINRGGRAGMVGVDHILPMFTEPDEELDYAAAISWLAKLFDYEHEPAEVALNAVYCQENGYNAADLSAAFAPVRDARHATRAAVVDEIFAAGGKNRAAGEIAHDILIDLRNAHGVVRFDYLTGCLEASVVRVRANSFDTPTGP